MGSICASCALPLNRDQKFVCRCPQSIPGRTIGGGVNVNTTQRKPASRSDELKEARTPEEIRSFVVITKSAAKDAAGVIEDMMAEILDLEGQLGRAHAIIREMEAERAESIASQSK